MNSSVLIILFGILLIATIALVTNYFDRKRTEALEAYARSIGLQFYPEATQTLMPTVCDFCLFSKGHSKRVKNLMQGALKYSGDSIPISVFDYRYATGHGKNRTHYHYSVLLFQSELLGLPDFRLLPENIFHKIGSLMGFQDIDFAAYPRFSSQYLLQGSSEPHIFKVFNPDVISFYENRRVGTEANGSRLIYYRLNSFSNNLIPPEEMHAFLSEGLKAFELLKQND